MLNREGINLFEAEDALGERVASQFCIASLHVLEILFVALFLSKFLALRLGFLCSQLLFQSEGHHLVLLLSVFPRLHSSF